mgnify:CR=1 FL=1
MYSVAVLASLALLVALLVWGFVPRHLASLLVMAILLVTGAVELGEVVEFVDWDVLALIFGMSIFTVYLEKSGFVDVVAGCVLRKVGDLRMLVFVLSMVSGLISLFLENVTVVLILAPVVFRIATVLGVDPAYVLVPVALASNMAGSATMVGDPPAIITAGYLGLSFTDFIWYRGRPSMFFLTVIPMVLACLTASAMVPRDAGSARRRDEPMTRSVDKVFLAETLFFLGAKVLLLSLRTALRLPLSLAVLVGLGGLTLCRLIHGDRRSVAESFRKGFEWRTLLFLTGVFVLSGAFAKHGLAKHLALQLVELCGYELLSLTSFLVWFSVAVSAFIDNVPYVSMMLPVISSLSSMLSVDPATIAWALLLGATLGGNLTFIGASANVVAVRVLEKQGRRVSFAEFMRISVPFNTVSVVSGWILYELLWILS